MKQLPVLVLLIALAACGQKPASEIAATAPPASDANSSAPAVAPVTPIDYAKPESWLCRPDVEDACEQVATTTSVSADGKLTKDRFVPAADPLIDCFYVYPTVSRDPTGNSDAIAGAEEMEVARQQAARFGAECRIFAPVYRQVTLAALRKMMVGETPDTNREMAYADVKAAWDRYLANDNGGRGVVLIGHSQGAGLLTRLIAAEIDGKPIQDRLVSALLIGSNLAVADPHEGGGSFKEIKLCTSANQFGCAISYVSFRAEVPPPANSLFGRADQQGMYAACVNPAELDGSNGQLKAMLPAGAILFDAMAPPGPWTTDNAEIETPFVSLPGMLSAECVNAAGFNYLAISTAADTGDKRIDMIAGDVVVDAKVQANWGLHLIDMNLAMGNLVAIVKRQGAEWRRTQPSDRQLPPEFQKPN